MDGWIPFAYRERTPGGSMFLFILFYFSSPCLVLDGAFDDTLKQRQPHVALGGKERRKR